MKSHAYMKTKNYWLATAFVGTALLLTSCNGDGEHNESNELNTVDTTEATSDEDFEALFDSPEVDNEVLVHNEDGFARIGDYANVEVTDAEEFDLFGKIV